MKRLLSRLTVLIGLGLASAGAAPAAVALNPAHVSADARWVVFADFNALRSSQLGHELIAELEKVQKQANGGLIGLDVPKLFATIGTVTAYGYNLTAKPEMVDGALVVQGTPDLRKIAESILLQGTIAAPKSFAEVNDLPFPAYALSDPKADPAKSLSLLIAFPPEPVILLSKSRAHLVKAYDVFRGAAPSLAKSASPLTRFARSAPSAYLLGTAIVPADPGFSENEPQTRLLKLTHSGGIAIGEKAADVFAHLELTASSDRNAEKLAKILEGMTSMLSLAESNDRQLAEFLNSVAVNREGEVVSLKLAYPSARLLGMMNNLREQAEPRPAARATPITMGRLVAEWTAAEVESEENGLAIRTLENVPLANGMIVNLGRALNGGRNAKFDRVEVVPAGGGAPLLFRSEMMRAVRGTMVQFPFPGVDGRYTLKVAYVNDPERKAKFAVSLQDAKPVAAPAPRPGGP